MSKIFEIFERSHVLRDSVSSSWNKQRCVEFQTQRTFDEKNNNALQ